MTNRINEDRAQAVRELLEKRLWVGRDDRRWDSYSAERMIREAQEEMADAMLYLEVLKDKLR
jgi:hypothetical protein